jgi:hypothetical protein
MIPRFEHIWHKGFGYTVDGNEITYTAIER